MAVSESDSGLKSLISLAVELCLQQSQRVTVA